MFIGVLQQQLNYGGAPPGGGEGESSLTIDSITVNDVSSVLTASYTLGGSGTEKNQLPIATSVRIDGLLNEDEELSGLYNYSHINNSSEGTSLFRWYRADDQSGTNETQIATTQNYTLTASEVGKYIKFDVIPVTGSTQGNTFTSGYTSSAVGTSLEEITVLVSFGSATSPTLTDSRTWNYAYTNDPTTSYELNNLVDIDNNTITGLNIDVDLTMSDQGNSGPTTAFDAGDGITYPANWSRGYWYSTDGTTGRGFQLEIPVSLQGQPFEIILAGAANTGGTNQQIIRVNGIEKQIANVEDNTSQYLIWTYTELVGASDFGQIQVRVVDGTGLSPIGVMEIHYKIPS